MTNINDIKYSFLFIRIICLRIVLDEEYVLLLLLLLLCFFLSFSSCFCFVCIIDIYIVVYLSNCLLSRQQFRFNKIRKYFECCSLSAQSGLLTEWRWRENFTWWRKTNKHVFVPFLWHRLMGNGPGQSSDFDQTKIQFFLSQQAATCTFFGVNRVLVENDQSSDFGQRNLILFFTGKSSFDRATGKPWSAGWYVFVALWETLAAATCKHSRPTHNWWLYKSYLQLNEVLFSLFQECENSVLLIGMGFSKQLPYRNRFCCKSVICRGEFTCKMFSSNFLRNVEIQTSENIELRMGKEYRYEDAGRGYR